MQLKASIVFYVILSPSISHIWSVIESLISHNSTNVGIFLQEFCNGKDPVISILYESKFDTIIQVFVESNYFTAACFLCDIGTLLLTLINFNPTMDK